jgi:hypothetical protein
MLIFGLGALGFASLLAWLTLTELKHDKPTTWSGWAQYVGVISGIACTAIVAVRAMF